MIENENVSNTIHSAFIFMNKTSLCFIYSLLI